MRFNLNKPESKDCIHFILLCTLSLVLLTPTKSLAALPVQTRYKLEQMGLKIIKSRHDGNCLYDAIGGQTGQSSQALRETLHHFLAHFFQNPNPLVFDLLDNALRRTPIHSSMHDLANFYLDGRLRRNGEWGELMLMPFIVYALNRPIILINLSSTLTDQPHLLIDTDLSFTEINLNSTAHFACTDNAIVLIFADDAYYGVTPSLTQETPDWQRSLIDNLAFLTTPDPASSSSSLPSPLPSNEGVYPDDPSLSDILQANLADRDYDSPFRYRLIRQPCNPCHPDEKSPCFRITIATINTDIEGFPIFYPANYLYYLAHQIATDRRSFGIQCKINALLHSAKPPEIKKRPLELPDIQDRIHQFNSGITATGASDNTGQPVKSFQTLVKKVLLLIKIARAFDDHYVHMPTNKAETGVPKNYLKYLAKASGKYFIVFGNRNVATGAKKHIENKNKSTKDFKQKRKTSDLKVIHSLIPTTPSLSKDNKKNLFFQEELRTSLLKDLTTGLIGLVAYTLTNNEVNDLLSNQHLTVETTRQAEDGKPLEIEMTETQADGKQITFVLIRPYAKENWDVYRKKQKELVRVEVITDSNGRIVTADLDPLFISFKLEKLDLAHHDKLPLPLITNLHAQKLTEQLKQITAPTKAQKASLEALQTGIDDFFIETVFLPHHPVGDTETPSLDREAINKLILLNPQLPTLHVLEKYWQFLEKKWVAVEGISGYLIRIPREHPDMGNVNPRAIELVELMNKALGRPDDNPAVHHNHDAHSPASNEALNYPADIYLPERITTTDENNHLITFNKGVNHIRDQKEMKRLVQALKDNDWYVTLNHALWPELSAIRSRQWKQVARVIEQHLQQHLKWQQEKDKLRKTH